MSLKDVLLKCGTVGKVNEGLAIVGNNVQVVLHDDNGNIIYVSGTITEVLS